MTGETNRREKKEVKKRGKLTWEKREVKKGGETNRGENGGK